MSAKIVEQKIPSQNQLPLNTPPKKIQKIILKFQKIFHLSNMFNKITYSNPCNLSTTLTPGQRTGPDTRLIMGVRFRSLYRYRFREEIP